MIALLVAALLFVAPPSEMKVPDHSATYTKEVSTMLYSSCMQAGKEYGFTVESMDAYCVCHLYILQDVVPWDKVDKMKKVEKQDLFNEITKACVELGYKPELKIKPTPKPKVLPGEGFSI